MHPMSSASMVMPFLTLTAHPAIGAVLLDSRPAWVWNAEGNRILWANAAGLDFFEEERFSALLDRTFGDVHPARRHLARLARNARTNAPLLDRLRFFLGTRAVTANCLCKRLEVEGEAVVLVMATDTDPDFDSEADRATRLIRAFRAEGDMDASLLDIHGQSIAEEINHPSLVPPAILDMLVKEATGKQGLAADTLAPEETRSGETDKGSLVAMARFGGEEENRFLLLRSPAPDDADFDLLLLEQTQQSGNIADLYRAEEAAQNWQDEADIFELASHPDHRSPDSPPYGHLDHRAELLPFLDDHNHDQGQESPSLSHWGPVKPLPPHSGNHEEAFDNVTSLPRRPVDEALSGNVTDLFGSASIEVMGGPDKSDDGDNVVALPANMTISESGTDKDGSHAGGDKGPCHFVWESDEVGRFTHLSPDLAKAVGSRFADLLGRSWAEVARALGMDAQGIVDKAFEDKEAWTGLQVMWPVEASDGDNPCRAPVEMTGLPVFGRFHGFQGFKGFGLCYTNQTVCDPYPPRGFVDAGTQEDDGDGAARHKPSLEGEELLAAADQAIEAAKAMAEVTGSADYRDGPDLPGLAGEPEGRSKQYRKDGAMTVSDDDKDQKKDTDHIDLDAQHAVEGSDREGRIPLEGYDLVARLLQQENDRLARANAQSDTARSEGETEDSVDLVAGDHPEGDFDEASMASLSRGEQDAFDRIAAALSIEQLSRSGGDQGDQDEDFEESDFLPHFDVEEEEEDDGDFMTPIPDDDTSSEAEAISETGMDEVARIASEESEQASESEAITISATDPEPASASGKADSAKDDALRTAASSAFRDILALDPAFRHMRGRLAQLDETDASNEGAGLAASSATHSGAGQPGSAHEEAPEQHALPLDEAADDPDLVIEAPSSTASQETEMEPVETAEPDVAEQKATEETSPDLVTSPDVDGVHAFDTALWDKNNKASPLIDILNKQPTPIIVMAGDEVLYSSKQALRLLDYDNAEALTKAGGMQALFTGRPGDWLTKTDGRTNLRKADGSPLTVLASVSSINWGETPAAMLSFLEAPKEPPSIGISEEDEKIAELEAILDTATDGVVVLDANANVLRMNHSAEALFEVDRHEVAGTSFLDMLAEESHRDALDYLDGLVTNGVTSVLNDGREVIGKVSNGGLIPLFMTMGRVAIPGTNRFCAVLRDVAEWKRVEEDLLAEKRRAEDASNQKSDFLAKVSHEIRTPLNAIIGFSEVMMDERFGAIGNERYTDYLRDIHTSGNHIMSLVNDLLDLSKVEAGKMDMRFEATELNKLVAESVALMQPQANLEQIIIRTSLSSKVPEVVGDIRSIKQIILNLLSNGVKYTPAGGQVIVSTVYEENGEVVLRIRDTGIGMSEEEVAMALEPFRQVASTRGAAQGTGLGLPLTKALAEANRARFSITSAKDHGTMAEIIFPNARVLAGE